jgi:hypothetical protein
VERAWPRPRPSALSTWDAVFSCRNFAALSPHLDRSPRAHPPLQRCLRSLRPAWPLLGTFRIKSRPAASRAYPASANLGRGWCRGGQGRHRRFQFRLVDVGDDVEALDERGAAFSSFVTGVTNGRGVRSLGPPLARPSRPGGRLATFMFGSFRTGARAPHRVPTILIYERGVSEVHSRKSFRHAGARWRCASLRAQVGSKCAMFLNSRFSLFLIFTKVQGQLNAKNKAARPSLIISWTACIPKLV